MSEMPDLAPPLWPDSNVLNSRKTSFRPSGLSSKGLLLHPPQVQRAQLQALKQAEDDASELLEQQLSDARQAKMAAVREAKERERRERVLQVRTVCECRGCVLKV